MDPRQPLSAAAAPDTILDADIAVLRLCDRTTNLLRLH